MWKPYTSRVSGQMGVIRHLPAVSRPEIRGDLVAGRPPIKSRGLREILRGEDGNSESSGTYLDLLRPLYIESSFFIRDLINSATSISGVSRGMHLHVRSLMLH